PPCGKGNGVSSCAEGVGDGKDPCSKQAGGDAQPAVSIVVLCCVDRLCLCAAGWLADCRAGASVLRVLHWLVVLCSSPHTDFSISLSLVILFPPLISHSTLSMSSPFSSPPPLPLSPSFHSPPPLLPSLCLLLPVSLPFVSLTRFSFAA
ncbi:unnamed protein product, partial [Closterium sp. NIES-65]